MGHHYVPIYYLNGFASKPEGAIWVYDKQNHKFKSRAKSVANVYDYYPEELEKYLANDVEAPANAVLKKIRKLKEITKEEKRLLAEYIVTMMKRVPKGKERTGALLPRAAEDLREEIDQEFNLLTKKQPEKIRVLEKHRTAANAYLDKCLNGPSEPHWWDNIPPMKTPDSVECLNGMTWRFLTYVERPAIIASDNPVFYFTDIGIGKPESELTFPLSSHMALWASWRTDLPEGFFPTTWQVVKELNRRSACNATRFLYHCKDEEWIHSFFIKGKWQLNRLY